MLEREWIENTPFTLIHVKQKGGWFIAIGNARVTDGYRSKEELLRKINNFSDWDILTTTIAIITEKVLDWKKYLEK